MKELRKHPLMIALLAGIAALYAAFVCLDLLFTGGRMLPSILKFGSIALCFALAACTVRHADNRKDSLLLMGALFFTLIADMLLLFMNLPILGVLCFCLAHLLYIRRYKAAAFLTFLLLYLLVLLIVMLGGQLNGPLPLLEIAGGFYGILILFVTYCAFQLRHPRVNAALIKAGMILFLLCDINVLLFNVMPPSGSIAGIAAQLMWVFYLPSQALLALSAFPFHPPET